MGTLVAHGGILCQGSGLQKADKRTTFGNQILEALNPTRQPKEP